MTKTNSEDKNIGHIMTLSGDGLQNFRVSAISGRHKTSVTLPIPCFNLIPCIYKGLDLSKRRDNVPNLVALSRKE